MLRSTLAVTKSAIDDYAVLGSTKANEPGPMTTSLYGIVFSEQDTQLGRTILQVYADRAEEV
jgi:hypothetical protein